MAPGVCRHCVERGRVMEPAAAWAAAAAGGADGAAGAAGVLAATTTSSDLAVFVPARAAREIKVALEARGWYDRTRLIGPGGGAGMMAVPVSRGGASDVAALLARLAADGGAAAAAAAEADGAVFVQVLGVARVGAAADLRPAKVARLAAARAADAAAAPAGGGGGGGGGGGDRGARRAVAVGVAQQPARPWRGPRYAPVPELRCVGICGGGGGDGGMQNRMGGGGDGGGGGGGGEEAVVRAISAALAARAPVALRGAYGAGVVASWAPEALRAATARGCGGGACGGECGGDGCRVASVHGSATPRLDFVCKNYAFVPMLLCDALGACLGWHVPSGGGAAEAGGAEGAAALSGRHLYMRAMASHARRVCVCVCVCVSVCVCVCVSVCGGCVTASVVARRTSLTFGPTFERCPRFSRSPRRSFRLARACFRLCCALLRPACSSGRTTM